MYFKKIEGKRIYLSPMDQEGAESYATWLNDYEIAKGVNQYNHVITVDSEKKYISDNSSCGQNYAIILQENDELIGNISLGKIDLIDQTAELGIFIGNKEYLSKGYGAEAINVILNYGFKYLNLRNVSLKVYSFNKRAIACYKKIGFKEFGVWKSSHYFDGEFCDEIFMNITKDDIKKED